MVWFVYILLCDQKTLYVSITENVKERLNEHIRGYSPFTKKFSDFELLYQESYQTRVRAGEREKQLKGWSVAKKKSLICHNINELKKLSKGR